MCASSTIYFQTPRKMICRLATLNFQLVKIRHSRYTGLLNTCWKALQKVVRSPPNYRNSSQPCHLHGVRRHARHHASSQWGGAVLKVFWIRQTGKTWNQKSSYILTHLRVNHWMNLDEIDYIGICSKSSMKLLLPTMLSDFVADEIVHGNLFGANA